ncbi:tyrosine-type recombinase/integrase [Crenalkalicoccus roseus]|uniref:tyrosine-type recombinase/integrase n=1 Tax=Crenalkalicoccus roseus TaxID=1485588 RepID=UPI001305127A|nr:tyrosine-type recombinase/integrase [Crenalkalicoccus roseus]
MSSRSKTKPSAGRVVRKTLADGTIREYRYGAWKPKPSSRVAPDSLDAVLAAYRQSPEFRAKAPATQAQYAIYLRPLDRIGHLRVRELGRRQILAIRDAIAATRGYGAATAFGRVVGAFLAWALDRGWIEHNPASRLRSLPGGSLPAWSDAQIAEALARLPEHLRRVVVLAVHTGQRRGDLCAMTWSAYDGQVIRVRQQKTGAPLAIPVHPELRAELDRWRAERGDSVLILTSPRAPRWTAPHLSREMKRALAAIGLPPRLNIHGLRKAAARRLAEAGCSAHEIAAITGHASLSMVQHYTRSVDQERLAQAAMARLPAGRERVLTTAYNRQPASRKPLKS